jgi:hypothetical protein
LTFRTILRAVKNGVNVLIKKVQDFSVVKQNLNMLISK